MEKSINIVPVLLSILLLLGSDILSEVTTTEGNVPKTEAEVVSFSYSKLKYFAKLEVILYKELKSHHGNGMQLKLEYSAVGNGTPMANIERYLEDYEESSGRVQGSPEERASYIAKHPLLSLRMIFRFNSDLQQQLIVSPDNWTKRMREFLDSEDWPDEHFLEEVIERILLILHTYDLDVEELANGRIKTHDVGFRLTARQCFEIASYALSKREYLALAVEFLEYGNFLVHTGFDSTIEPDVLEEELSKAAEIHDNELARAQGIVAKTNFLHHIVPEGSEGYKYNGIVKRIKQREFYAGEGIMDNNVLRFWNLCSGKNLQSEEKRSQLSCWYDFRSNLAWTIQPLQVELLSRTPYILQIYNVLSNSDMETIIREGEPKLKDSRVGTGSRLKVSKIRNSQGAWIHGESTQELENKISRKLELVTGLVVIPETASEKLYLVSYSFGGQYSLHQDTITDPKERWLRRLGNRIATFMIYLSDVKEGGYTAFPIAGVAAVPVRGSTVVWYNLKLNGEQDRTTEHGACPVIMGQKLVANKWIRAWDQFQTRQCSLDPFV